MTVTIPLLSNAVTLGSEAFFSVQRPVYFMTIPERFERSITVIERSRTLIKLLKLGTIGRLWTQGSRRSKETRW